MVFLENEMLAARRRRLRGRREKGKWGKQKGERRAIFGSEGSFAGSNELPASVYPLGTGSKTTAKATAPAALSQIERRRLLTS